MVWVVQAKEYLPDVLGAEDVGVLQFQTSISSATLTSPNVLKRIGFFITSLSIILREIREVVRTGWGPSIALNR